MTMLQVPRGATALWWSLLFLVSASLPAGSIAESWTDLRGKRTIDARMVGLWGETLVLELSSGRRVSVKLDSLRGESRIQARRLSEKLARQRSERIQQLQQAARSAAAAAPNPLPTPDRAPAYQPPTADMDPQQYLDRIDQAIASGHLLVFYDLLPPSYRSDIDDVVAMVAGELNADQYQTIVGCLHQLGSSLVHHQNWLLSSPRIQASTQQVRDQIKGPVLSFAGLLDATMNTELLSLKLVRSQPFGQWLAEFDRATCDYLYQFNQSLGQPASRAIQIDAREDQQMSVTIQVGDRALPVTLVKTNGHWLPPILAQQNWDLLVGTVKQAIATSDASQWLDRTHEIASQSLPLLKSLSQSSSEAEFHASIESAVRSVSAAIPELATAIGRASGGSATFDDEDLDDF